MSKLIDKYLGEGLKAYVEVKDSKGNRVTKIDASDFLKHMEKEFKKFKFVKDAVDFYNKKYKDNHATLNFEKK